MGAKDDELVSKLMKMTMLTSLPGLLTKSSCPGGSNLKHHHTTTIQILQSTEDGPPSSSTGLLTQGVDPSHVPLPDPGHPSTGLAKAH